jgi:protein-tyrosine phosphatase
MKILLVCTGNICRSPSAEGVLAHKAKSLGLNFKVDSAGTHAYHVGENPDPRSVQHAKKRGYDISEIVARKFDFADFYEFDLIFALDRSHFSHLMNLYPDNANAELHLFLDYAGMGEQDVPDPYYGGAKGFENVLDLIEQASDNIIKKLSSGNQVA